MATMAVDITDEDFDELVAQALDLIPQEFWDKVDNVVVQVVDEPPEDEPDLLGLYEGVALSERDFGYAGTVPDQVLIFRGPLRRLVDTVEDLREEIAITVIHEIGHYFGIDDDHLDDLGWG